MEHHLAAVAMTGGCPPCLLLRLKVVEATMEDLQGVVATPVLHLLEEEGATSNMVEALVGEGEEGDMAMVGVGMVEEEVEVVAVAMEAG